MFNFEFTPFLAFIILGLFLIILELIIGIQAGFDLVLLGTILVAGGLIGNLTNSLLLCIVISTLLSILYIAFGRSMLKKNLVFTTHKTNIDNMIGKTGIVTEAIELDRPGKVLIDTEHWRAKSHHTLALNDKVTVLQIEGVTLIVEKQTV